MWVKVGNYQQCYKPNEAALVYWDAVPEANYPASRSIEPFDEMKWDKSCNGSRRREWSNVDYWV